ncbi:GLPGLI family protein [Mesonia phycicola]|uniref:GLPGLI family protein n=1 Tax=Mesonia phycicola TaxID=579105 RepID=A0A1M6FFZ3_9FLAO|nr:GLPGLI family protein [Mesonia phycicola]SHI96579.1 GLPGLI family protein [Mesonia phycicola]
MCVYKFQIKINTNGCFLSILLFFPILVFSQISGEIEFGTEYLNMAIDTSKVTGEEVKDFLVMQDNTAKRVLADDETYFTVKFNLVGAHVEKVKMMDYNNSLLPTDFINITELFYKDSKLYINRNIGKDRYYVDLTDKYHYNWKLHSEYKTILGYKCQKATTNMPTAKYKREVVAWFTTDIPVSYGTSRYYGLPGFILELHEMGRMHYARKIKFKEDLKIDFPSEDLLVTEEEYKSFFK